MKDREKEELSGRSIPPTLGSSNSGAPCPKPILLVEVGAGDVIDVACDLGQL